MIISINDQIHLSNKMKINQIIEFELLHNWNFLTVLLYKINIYIEKRDEIDYYKFLNVS